MNNGQIETVELEQVENRLNLVTPDHKLVKSAKSLGTSFGEKEK